MKGIVRVVARYMMAAAVAAGSLFSGPTQTHGQDIRFLIGGAANHIRWDDQLGLDNGRLFGVRAGIDFGPVVGLRAHYLQGDDFSTRFDEITIVDDAPTIENQDVKVNSIGGDIVVNLLSGSFIPYALAGGGILRFQPAEGSRSDQIYGRLGAGVGFEISRSLRADVWAANTRMRMDRFRFAPPLDGGYPGDPESDDLRSNWTYGIGLGLDLGGTGRTAVAQQWSALSFPVQLYAGQLRYDRGGIEDQNLIGARAGVDFRLVGLRAFYWRGLNDDWDDTNRIQSFGGEAQFNLSAGSGIAPFLVLGAGRLDYRDGFADPAGVRPDDEEFLIGGAGLAIRLTDAFTINVAARDYIFSTVDPEDVSSTDELTHNWLFSAGIGFNVGRTRSEPTLAQAPSPDEAVVRGSAAEGDRTARAGTDDPRVIQIPVPERGEVYIRFGEGARMQVQAGDAAREAGRLTSQEMDSLAEALAAQLSGQRGAARTTDATMDAERLRAIIRDELARIEPAAARVDPAAPARDAAAFAAQDQRLREVVREELERLGIREQLEQISRELRERETQREQPARTVVVEPDRDTARTRVVEVDDQPGIMGSLVNPVAYLAVALSEPSHVAFGGRIETGRLRGMESVAVVPEAALGFVNDGTSFLGAANLEYSFAQLMMGDNFSIRPVVRPGIGILSVPGHGTEGVLNFTYGFTSRVGRDSSMRWFVEHQGIDLFDRSRLSAGLSWTR
jgi:hypothetical protein